MNGINTELFKYAGITFQYRLLYLFNNIWNGQLPPKSCDKVIVIPIYKKGDKKNCDNYWGISLFNSGYKLYTNIIKNKLSTFYNNKLGEEQNGFQIGRWQLFHCQTPKIEKHREFNIETHLLLYWFCKSLRYWILWIDKIDTNSLRF